MRRKPLFPPPKDQTTGKTKRNKGRQDFSVLTINGRVRLWRRRWHSPGEGTSTPLDAWLDTVESGLDVDLTPDDFDVVFAYPWPDEEYIIEELFARHADAGALLLTYHDSGDIKLRRKRRK